MPVGSREKRAPTPRRRRPDRGPAILSLSARTLADLAEIDEDRSKAVARAASAFVGGGAQERPPVDLVPVAEDAAVLVVARCRALDGVPWAHAVRIGPGRYLLATKPGTPITGLEVGLVDLLEETEDGPDRAVLEELLRIVRRNRRRRSLSKAEILLVHPETPRSRR